MARYFQGKSGYGRAEWPNKKKTRPEELTQDTPEEEEEEAEFVHTLSPKQKAEYDGLDKEQKALVKYVLGVPGVDVSKIDLSGNKQKESTAVSAPPFPTRREAAHSGSGRKQMSGTRLPDRRIGGQASRIVPVLSRQTLPAAERSPRQIRLLLQAETRRCRGRRKERPYGSGR